MAIKKSTSSTLDPKVASALSYIPFVGWVAAIVLLIVGTTPVVRWHAIQGLLVTVIGTVLMLLLNPLLSGAVLVVVIVLQLVLAVKAYQGETLKLPLLGAWVDRIVTKK